MPIPAVLKDRLRLPVIASPTRIISNPDLVIAQCKAGVVGSFPALNARPPELLDQWLTRIQEEAVDKGAEGLIAVAAGAGGHAGTQSPMALIQEIRQWWDGPLALSGAIATGRSVLMAQVMKPGVHRHTRGQRRRRRQGNDRRVGGRGHRLHQPRHRDARQLDRADADPAIRAVMFSDNGDCFTTGIDLGDFLANPPTIGDGPVGRFIRALAGARKVLVAAVHGAAASIGTTMLLHCDLVFAAHSPSLSLPFVKLGLLPKAGSSLLLPRLWPPKRSGWLPVRRCRPKQCLTPRHC